MDDGTLRTAIAAADGDDPYRALRELHHARVRLNNELDRAEALAVRRARAAGSSWQVIALALEVSRQAVHKKYGRA
jgi:DNA invertase Pin-like site-specific DNA recombinase